MRIGLNPNLEASVPAAPEVVAAVITHLPVFQGYHEKRHNVVAECITSLRDHAGQDISLLVWDNGSDLQLKKWLQYSVQPDYLILSPNIGKANARKAILGMFPPETILCFSDDDIYFYPNWLEPQLELLRTFPNVGAVSGCPIRTNARWGIDSTLAWARQNASLTTGRFIPDEWEFDFCRSIGRDYMRHIKEATEDTDYLIEYQGKRAYAAAHHMQFIGYAGRLSPLANWGDRAMRLEVPFDLAVDGAGYLRLTTTERLTRHIGNIPEEF